MRSETRIFAALRKTKVCDSDVHAARAQAANGSCDEAIARFTQAHNVRKKRASIDTDEKKKKAGKQTFRNASKQLHVALRQVILWRARPVVANVSETGDERNKRSGRRAPRRNNRVSDISSIYIACIHSCAALTHSCLHNPDCCQRHLMTENATSEFRACTMARGEEGRTIVDVSIVGLRKQVQHLTEETVRVRAHRLAFAGKS